MNGDDLLFKGLKVLDVGTWIAAPVATTMLADYGADVIKIELPGVGDAYRIYSGLPSTPASPHNYCWLMDARNKRSLSLNLKTAEGMAILHQLIEGCDIYVTNQPLALRRSLKLMYDDVHSINPRVIYASLTAYGEEGPEQDREGFDLVAYWSRSGLMDLVREIGAAPASALPGMGDHPTAVTMYANIVTALLKRERTGEGSFVHTSLLANGLWSVSCVAQAALLGADFTPFKNPVSGGFQRSVYLTADGRYLHFAMIRTVEEFDLLLLALEATELLADPRFATPELRYANGALFIEALRPYPLKLNAAEWMARFREMGIPAALMARVTDLAVDPQVLANHMIREAPAEFGTGPIIDHPLNVEGLARVPMAPPPALGQHSREILADLGFDETAIADLAARGVI
ncbi:MAG: CoA transferase [Gammaproteobacteria bacterium]|nr:CoA transferase [Gammaproteobacteria bacterium]